MAMNDDSMVKVMESLGLDYGPAERSTKAFENRIASLNQQLFQLKANAIKGAGDINNVFSSQLGSMSGNKMILDQYGQPLKILNDNMASSFVKSTAAAKQHGQAVQDVANKYNILGNEFQRRAQWFLTGTLFYGTLRAATETAQTISEVEMGVTEIARVMEDETFVFENYRNQLLQLGVDYGQTFDVVQDIALRWAQAGYNVKDSLDNTKTSLLALNTAELDASNATESMIGIMSQWQMTSADLPLVLDKINKTADDFTVTSQDLVDGLLRSSGAAKIMGLSLDETISLLTVMREASGRTGREVGNALNSILSYVQRPSAIKTLEGLGIQMFADKAKTQFRNVMLIFQDIQSKWNSSGEVFQDAFVKAADDTELFSEELSTALGMQEKYNLAKEEYNDLEKRDIAQASAGVYRRNYFIGLIERLSTAQEVLNGMIDAAGYSQAENARTMETLQKKYTSLLAAAQELAVALGDAGLMDALKGATEFAKDAADSFADLDDSTQALVLTVLELLAAASAIKSIGSLFGINATLGAAVATAPGWTKLIPLIIAAAGAVGLYAYNSSKASAQSIEDSLKNADAKQSEIDETNRLIQKYQELEGKAVQSNEVKGEMLDIQRQLASIYPDYVDGLDDEGNKLVTNIPLLREMNALKQQELELEQQKIMVDAKTRLPQLQAEQKRLQEQIDKNKQRLSSGDTKELMGNIGAREVDVSGQIRQETIELVQKLAEARLEEETIKSIMKSMNASDEDINDTLARIKSGGSSNNGGGTGGGTQKCPKCGAVLDKDGKCPNCDKKTGTYKNEPLQDALQLLQHKKAMNEISLQDEIAYLKKVRDTYVQTGEERMDIEERIYSAENDLRDKTLQDSINWINEKKALGELSAEQEIAAWNRVLTNQKNNIEAVKQATQNLYRLQKELREEEVQENKDSLKDLQDTIKDAYDKRIDAVEKEAEAQKKAQEEIIKGIEEEEKALDRSESEYDYDKKMADLEEQLAYWSVRTGEEARQNLADIREQIAEAEHDREVELQKQGLDDKKQAAEDEIDTIEEAAKEEKEKWEAAYKDMEKAFEDHNLDIIAQAATYSKEAYQQWYDNYIVPMQEALKNGDIEGFGDIAGNVGGSIGTLPSHDYGMTDEDYLLMMANKERWWELFNAGNVQKSNTEMQQLNKDNDVLRTKYGIPAGEYPNFDKGGLTLTAGFAKVIPGDFYFPPSFSQDIMSLIKVASGISGKVPPGSSTSYDNSKKVNLNGPLLNVENMNMEDETDAEILSKELNRAVLSLV